MHRWHNLDTPLRSLLDHALPPLGEAERRLADLAARTRTYGPAALLLAPAAPIVALLDARLAVALGAAAAAAVALALAARGRRRSLLDELLREREAYAIDAVRDAGNRFASDARRYRLAAWVRGIVGTVEGTDSEHAYNLVSLTDRVRDRRERLLALADALDSQERTIHPASVSLLYQLLTRPPLSPLYNPGLDEELLDFALHRVEAGIDPR
jgi:hypothetical protein